MNDRLWFLIAALIVAASTLWSFLSKRNNPLTRRGVQFLLALALLSLSLFLLERGEAIRRCPLTNGFEATAFLTWGVLLTYFLIGSSYRLSILGAFTAPLALLLLTFGGLFSSDQPSSNLNPVRWSSEFHAAISILSYGTLGLSAICALMYLIQEHHLKKHTFSGWFDRLPSMGDLEIVLHRLLRWGFLLMTLGMLSGFATGLFDQVSMIKLLWATVVWIWYLGLLLSPFLLRLSNRRFAWVVLIGYILVLLSFGMMNSLIGNPT